MASFTYSPVSQKENSNICALQITIEPVAVTREEQAETLKSLAELILRIDDGNVGENTSKNQEKP